MLRNSIKVSDTTKTEFMELKFFQIGRNILQNYCREDFINISNALTC